VRKDRQVEGWFKGELMVVFDQAKGEGILSSWEPEVSYDHGTTRLKCDFAIVPTEDPGWIIGVEVKTACLGMQHKRTLEAMAHHDDFEQTGPWRLKDVITGGAGRKGGLVRDADKLQNSQILREKVCLLFAYGKQDDFADLAGFFGQVQSKFSQYLADAGEPTRVVEPDPAPIDLEDGTRLQVLAYHV